MWVEIKQVRTLMVAQMWKEFFEGEGIPTRVMPESGMPAGQESANYKIYIPDDRKHVAEEVLRKL
ncbi:MAG TPA: hypothetical protein VEI27_01005 [Dehalococcoidales bacterium]|nr:hypothetical protein [Dehalococcoidales bacterium]